MFVNVARVFIQHKNNVVKIFENSSCALKLDDLRFVTSGLALFSYIEQMPQTPRSLVARET